MARTTRAILLGLTVIACAGAVNTRDAPVRTATSDAIDRVESSHAFSPCSKDLLSNHDLIAISRRDPQSAAILLEESLQAKPGDRRHAPLALAELWYRHGLSKLHQAPEAAIVSFRNAAAAAAIGIGQPHQACCVRTREIHNRAVGRILRLSQSERVGEPAAWRETLAGLGVLTGASEPFVDPSRWNSIQVADDIKVSGMAHEFHAEGLGVPVVGLRYCDREHPTEPSERFYPRKLRISATVTAMPGGGLEDAAYRTVPLLLMFHDVSRSATATVGVRSIPLAADRSTALAVMASNRMLAIQTRLGLLSGAFQPVVPTGLFMLEPYRPGKIPVVLVHGLNSNPLAFVQTINDLSNDPVVGSRYQFWVFCYPTGRPIPTSAALLRQELHQARAAFGTDPAFDRMVVAGHSMGGVLTRMMVTDSRLALWNATINVPYENLRASPETRAKLDELLIFRPLPFVSRVIFLATPHRGSSTADRGVGQLVSRLFRPPAEQVKLVEELRSLNGQDVIADEIFQGGSINSLASLSRRSPVLLALDRLPIERGIPYHSIIYQVAGVAQTDLVVPYWSAHIEGATTERIFRGTHLSEQSEDSIGEMRRILLEHVEGSAG